MTKKMPSKMAIKMHPKEQAICLEKATKMPEKMLMSMTAKCS
jgi:hypothetical protein